MSQPRIYRSLAEAVIETLHSIFDEGRYADRAIEFTLKADPRRGAKDRAFIAENTYGIVRYWRLLNSASRNDNDRWEVLAIWLYWNGYESLPDWSEFKDVRREDVLKKIEELSKVRKFKESIPDWLDELGLQELPQRWDKELSALNERAPVVLRVNTLKARVHQVIDELDKANIETHTIPAYPDALRLAKPANVFGTVCFKEGWIEVQDASSQLVAAFTRVQPGMRVVDACAGGGGKSLHLAALMQNKGRLVSMDTEAWKLDNLKKRARRAGVSIIETRVIDSTKVIKRMYDSADRLVLDVPCSGIGVIKRNPDAKWKLKPEFITNIQQTQQEILQKYAPIVKPGGLLLYSTCSILPSENRVQIDRFLAENEGKFKLLEDRNIYPSETGYDGFYMALLERIS